jgi:phosphate starvation-inducible PhoH-like protein
VVRHKLVGKIVDAYERYDAKAEARGKGQAASRPPRHRGSR